MTKLDKYEGDKLSTEKGIALYSRRNIGLGLREPDHNKSKEKKMSGYSPSSALSPRSATSTKGMHPSPYLARDCWANPGAYETILNNSCES